MSIKLTPSPALADQLRAKKRMSPWVEPFYVLLTKKYLATFGLIILLAMLLMAFLANLLSPYDPVAQDLAQKLKPPSAQHILGTDHLGRDLFSRILHGARTSLYVGFGVMVLGTTVAVILGTVSAYVGGKFDIIYQRFVDAVQSMPALLVLLTIVSVIGPGLLNIILALAFRGSIGESRVVRSAVLGIKENQYMDAARALGASHLRVILLYIMPNIMAPVIIIASLALGSAILAEATLSFLGFGVPPPHPTWGGMLSNEARRFMISAPWMAIFPGLALSLAVFGINMFGDGLRDVLDPRLRGSR